MSIRHEGVAANAGARLCPCRLAAYSRAVFIGDAPPATHHLLHGEYSHQEGGVAAVRGDHQTSCVWQGRVRGGRIDAARHRKCTRRYDSAVREFGRDGKSFADLFRASRAAAVSSGSGLPNFTYRPAPKRVRELLGARVSFASGRRVLDPQAGTHYEECGPGEGTLFDVGSTPKTFWVLDERKTFVLVQERHLIVSEPLRQETIS